MPSQNDASAEEKGRLLQDDISEEPGQPAVVPQYRVYYRQLSTSVCTFSIVQLLLLAIYTFAFFALRGRPTSSSLHKTGQVYSPALAALKWEPTLVQNALDESNPFKGPPRPELDDAWNKLLAPTAMKVPKEDLDRINQTSVPLLDGSGYMVTLDVYHQLHCLKYVRKYLHPDYYDMHEPNPAQHVDHCLDSLRQYIMCNADVVLNTYTWIPNFRRPWPNFENVHECANWDEIETWALERSFDGFDESLVAHPDYHPELAGPFVAGVSENDG